MAFFWLEDGAYDGWLVGHILAMDHGHDQKRMDEDTPLNPRSPRYTGQMWNDLKSVAPQICRFLHCCEERFGTINMLDVGVMMSSLEMVRFETLVTPLQNTFIMNRPARIYIHDILHDMYTCARVHTTFTHRKYMCMLMYLLNTCMSLNLQNHAHVELFTYICIRTCIHKCSKKCIYT